MNDDFWDRVRVLGSETWKVSFTCLIIPLLSACFPSHGKFTSRNCNSPCDFHCHLTPRVIGMLWLSSVKWLRVFQEDPLLCLAKWNFLSVIQLPSPNTCWKKQGLYDRGR